MTRVGADLLLRLIRANPCSSVDSASPPDSFDSSDSWFLSLNKQNIAISPSHPRRNGLRLDDLMMAQLLEGAPYALGMAQRLRRSHGLQHEPANIMSFPTSWLGDSRPA